MLFTSVLLPCALLLLAAIEVKSDPINVGEMATAAEAAAGRIRSLLLGSNGDGSGPWGDVADLMGLLVRLEFHDAFTYDAAAGDGGTDGCIDLQSPTNKGLEEAINLLEPIRLGSNASDIKTDRATILSRADFWALAANVMIEAAGGPPLEYKMGRVDIDECEGHGVRQIEAESRSSVKISEIFVERLRFSPREVVALNGAHVLGRATQKNSGYEGPWVGEPAKFSNAYFSDLIEKQWVLTKSFVEPFGERTTWRRWILFGNQKEIMLPTDVDLAYETNYTGFNCSRVGGAFNKYVSCPLAKNAFSSHVVDFASNQTMWFNEFTIAWAKLTTLTNRPLYCAHYDCKTPRSSAMTKTCRALYHVAMASLIYILIF